MNEIAGSHLNLRLRLGQPPFLGPLAEASSPRPVGWGLDFLVDEADREERERAWALIANEVLDAIRGVKRMIRGLRPPKLDQQGLVSALATLFRDAQKVHGVTIHASGRLD